MDPMTMLIVSGAIFCFGFDTSSFTIMRKIDPTYKQKYRLLVGYSTFKVWQSYRKASKNDRNT